MIGARCRHCCIWLISSWFIAPGSVADTRTLIGQSEKVYTLAPGNTQIKGLAFDDLSPHAPRLFVLDHTAGIFIYKLDGDADSPKKELQLSGNIALPNGDNKSHISDPRGLAYDFESGRDIFYFLDWDAAQARSQLWRADFEINALIHIDLTQSPCRIGQRQVYDLAYDNGILFVCFDASGYKENTLRVARGILKLRWNPADADKLEFLKHMPDSGEFPSHGLALMQFEGARYLWATAGNDHIYSAQAQTGRGLFYFNRPTSTDNSRPCLGLAFGDNALWVPEGLNGPDRVHRVNVTQNLDAFYQGPRILRHLVMTIRTEPEAQCDVPGKVYHYYSRPYAYEQLHNQGIWPETERIADTSNAPNAAIKPFTYDPAGDIAARQHMSLVEYADAPARHYSSQYEIDIWTSLYRKYIYPHRVNQNTELAKTSYLADDPNLFNLSDTKTYDRFLERVAGHCKAKYGVSADMDHPYWAARNVLEYIQDNYYYPAREQGRPATVDYNNHHYDANPGNLKIALSQRPYDQTQITACSGTSVMLTGAMRYLGIQARWLGTGAEKSANQWDKNHNGLLDEEESAPCSNGHRYTQVWLGSNYGWVCFDATPLRPEYMDYDPAPPIRSQWQYMNRAARGHLLDKRIVFNVGSALFVPLYRDFEYEERLILDNNCGGDQRYNLQGRFDKPRMWKLPRHSISVENLCFLTNIEVSGPKNQTEVTWKRKGCWDRDPQATLSVYLQQISSDTNKARDIALLAKALPCESRRITVDLSNYSGRSYRIIIRKDGDSETGGHSKPFDLQ
ncbi:MAG: hypothetical protein JW828_02515 [Sedimentisphaerales bacterium]|nr:hypothetical protein [Sedimentisphaerales bacterium]